MSASSWETLRVESWGDFAAAIAETTTPHSVLVPTFFYRGQPRDSWDLQTSIQRALGPLKDQKLALQLEDLALREFREGALPFLPPQLIPRTDHFVNWWPIMQHYGAPTRLLDWTASPYVAAYFACAEAPDCDGAVWTIEPTALQKHFKVHTRDITELVKSLREATQPQVLPFSSPVKTDRMIAQRGHFVAVAPLDVNVADTLCTAHVESSQTELAHGRLIIPKDLKHVFLAQLRTMNITAASLFPGLDGLGRSATDIVRLGSYEPPPI
ncbi:MAG: FRG domain-containing protein [Gemmatimonadota bacterium]